MGKETNPEDPERQARSVAMRLLARREHSRFELAMKLRQRRLDASAVEPVLDEFEQEGWLSDERFAEVYGRQRLELGYGPLRILSELQQRGVDQAPTVIRDQSEEAWQELAVQVRARRFGLGDIRDDWDERVRQARFLTRRGFTGEQVEKALDAH